MGVKNLWKILKNCAEEEINFDDKKLAIDISIWMYQYSSLPHNQSLYFITKRILKLIYYKIKPVFVFDGNIPDLKRKVCEERRNLRNYVDLSDLARKFIEKKICKICCKKYNECVHASVEKDNLFSKIYKNCIDRLENHEYDWGDDISSMSEYEYNIFFDNNEHNTYDCVTDNQFTDTEKSNINAKNVSKNNLNFREEKKKIFRKEKCKVNKYNDEGKNISCLNISEEEHLKNIRGKEIFFGNLTDYLDTKEYENLSKKKKLKYLVYLREMRGMSSYQDNSDMEKFSISQMENVKKRNKVTTHISNLGCAAKKRVLSDCKTYFEFEKNSKNIFIDEIFEENKKEIKSINLVETDEKEESLDEWLKEVQHNSFDSQEVNLAIDVSNEDSFNNLKIIESENNKSEYFKQKKECNESSLKDISGKISILSENEKMVGNLGSDISVNENLKTSKNIYSFDLNLESNIQTEKRPELIKINDSNNNITFECKESNISNEKFINLKSEDKGVKYIDDLGGKSTDSKFEDNKVKYIDDLGDKSTDSKFEEENTETIDLATKYSEEAKSESSDLKSYSESCTPHIPPMRHIEDITYEPKDGNDPNNLISKTSITIDSLQNTEILNQTQVIPENGITDIKISNNLIPQELNFAIAVQSLLKAFNLPYIISPMEADSQCAYLNINNIVDGVITEDNDVLIYGANKVYRNFFKKNKVPTCYSLQNIQSKLNLNQLDLIKLCYLLGSDYNIGQKGFGIVKSLQAIKNNEVADSSIEFLKNIYLNSNVTEIKEYEIFPTNKISRKNDIIMKVKKVLNENYVDEQNINEIIKLIVKIL
ncbi:hypothetical protein LUQ84_001546 [Hamiltosporidium tvaerminnensis]|nr:hypothetical protein LUQ84_001546 [Hamiltosporidium tvaerminnensis]